MAAPQKPSGRAVSRAEQVPAHGAQTELQAQHLAAQRDEEAAQAAAELVAQAQNDARQRRTQVTDYTGADEAIIEAEPLADDDQSDREFICRVDLPEMTYGIKTDKDGNILHGKPRILKFEEGRRYNVPYDLYMHMERIGAVYH